MYPCLVAWWCAGQVPQQISALFRCSGQSCLSLLRRRAAVAESPQVGSLVLLTFTLDLTARSRPADVGDGGIPDALLPRLWEGEIGS